MTTIAKKKSAYILMEVIVSIVILSIVGISLLKVNSNEKKLYTIASSKIKFLRYVSVPLSQHSIDLHRKDLDMYDMLKDRYDFRNDKLIQELKNIKINYSQKYKSMVSFSREKTNVNLLIDEIVLKNKKASSRFLTVKQ